MRNGHQLFTLFLLIISSTWGQNGVFIRVDFDLNAQNIEMQGILKDDQGFLFLATNNGLYHYDGVDSKHILSYEKPDFQLDDFIRLTEISQEEILLGTKRGLYVFNIRNYNLTKILLIEKGEPEFILISKVLDGWVYVFNSQKEAFKLNIKSGKKKPIVLDQSLLKENIRLCILQENNNQLKIIGQVRDANNLFNRFNITTKEKEDTSEAEEEETQTGEFFWKNASEEETT